MRVDGEALDRQQARLQPDFSAAATMRLKSSLRAPISQNLGWLSSLTV